jgi:hypothetical protein
MERVKSVESQKFTSISSDLQGDQSILLDEMLDALLDVPDCNQQIARPHSA